MKQYITQLKMKLPKKRIEGEFPYASGILLILILIDVFIVPVFPRAYFTYFHKILLTGIFFSAIFSIKRNHILLIVGAVILTTANWISTILIENAIVNTVFRIIQFFFFLFLAGSLIAQISRTATVTLEVIIDSITGYLLLGFAFSIMVTVISFWIPDAYTVTFIKSIHYRPDSIQNSIYYTFMTFTTTGYGDILPNHPLSKSLAVLISVCGQLYIAIIIAMLVGKYASSEKSKNLDKD